MSSNFPRHALYTYMYQCPQVKRMLRRWDQFFGNCTGCRVDFMATHYYTCSAQYLQWYLNDVYTKYQRPIWLTEWACPNEKGTLSTQIRYLRNALKVLDDHSAVDRRGALRSKLCMSCMNMQIGYSKCYAVSAHRFDA